MSILIQFALLVLVAAIVVFFSKEFGQWIKKFFTIPGTILLVPLISMSWLVMYFQKDIWNAFWYMHNKLQSAIFIPVSGSSFLGQSILSIMMLTVLSVLPVLVINQIYWRRNLRVFKHDYLISTIIWIILATLLIMKA